MNTILVVEDDRNVGQTLLERLTKEGFVTTLARTFEEARHEIQGRVFDLALLDVGLPDGNGFQVAQLLKKTHPHTAIIFLTAFHEPEDRVRGLELGAEDYIAKPFHLKELILRIRNALKRHRSAIEPQPEEVIIGRARVFFARFEVFVDNNKPVQLSQKECALLQLLVERQDKVVSRDEILNRVWSEDDFPTTRTVDNFIMRLRRLVEQDAENPQLIRTVRGVGYILTREGPVE